MPDHGRVRESGAVVVCVRTLDQVRLASAAECWRRCAGWPWQSIVDRIGASMVNRSDKIRVESSPTRVRVLFGGEYDALLALGKLKGCLFGRELRHAFRVVGRGGIQ